MTHCEKANLIAYMSSTTGPARFYLRWPFDTSDPMGAAIVFNRSGTGDHLIVTNGPTPSCKLKSWTKGDFVNNDITPLVELFKEADEWFAATPFEKA